jgi:PHD/YefM family antitoxin component YafN of YafNO toxin-antitoxin module
MAKAKRTLARQFVVTEDGHITAVVIPIDEYEAFLDEVRELATESVRPTKSKAKKKAKKTARKRRSR